MSNMCRRCGLFHLAYKCPAWNSRCYRCGTLGHLARQCFKNCNFSNSLLYERKKKRDTERMTNFMRMKNMQNLPFFGLETSEIINLFPKHENANIAFIKIMKNIQQKHEEKSSSLETENNKLQTLVNDLQNKVLKEQRRCFAIENSKNEADYLIEKMKEELNQSKELNLELECKLKTSEDSHQQHIIKLNQEITSLHLVTDYHDLAEQEFKEVLDEIYEKIGDKPTKPVKNFSCRRCGSLVFHKFNTCFAQHNKCSICGKKNHFTSMCEQWLEVAMVTDSTEIQV